MWDAGSMAKVVRVRLTGADVELGRVAASDVAKLLLGAERVLRFSASSILAKPHTTGRWGRVIEQVTCLRLVAINPGSVEGVLELPDLEVDDYVLDLDASHLGEDALDLALRTVRGEATDPSAAAALVRWADDVGVGARVQALHVDVEGAGGVPAVIDAATHQRLREVASGERARRSDTVVGTLVEADFERHTAWLRTADEKTVGVTFDDDLADDIQEALRRTAELVGEVVYDPRTEAAQSVSLRRISHGEQLALAMETGDFWVDVPFEQQRRQQDVGPAREIDALSDADLSDEEAGAFLAAVDPEA